MHKQASTFGERRGRTSSKSKARGRGATSLPGKPDSPLWCHGSYLMPASRRRSSQGRPEEQRPDSERSCSTTARIGAKKLRAAPRTQSHCTVVQRSEPHPLQKRPHELHRQAPAWRSAPAAKAGSDNCESARARAGAAFVFRSAICCAEFVMPSRGNLSIASAWSGMSGLTTRALTRCSLRTAHAALATANAAAEGDACGQNRRCGAATGVRGAASTRHRAPARGRPGFRATLPRHRAPKTCREDGKGLYTKGVVQLRS